VYQKDNIQGYNINIINQVQEERKKKKLSEKQLRQNQIQSQQQGQQLQGNVGNIVPKHEDNSHIELDSDKKHLQNLRILQRNLVYIVGLPLNYAKEDLLRRKEFLGKFGRIVKVAINKKNSNGRATCSAYITFKDEKDAIDAINMINKQMIDGKMLRATFGTTKYCSYFLRSIHCTNPNCLYLHEYAREEDCYTKEELALIDRFSIHQNLQEISNSSREGTVVNDLNDEIEMDNESTISRTSSKDSLLGLSQDDRILSATPSPSPSPTPERRSIQLPGLSSFGSFGKSQCWTPARESSVSKPHTSRFSFASGAAGSSSGSSNTGLAIQRSNSMDQHQRHNLDGVYSERPPQQNLQDQQAEEFLLFQRLCLQRGGSVSPGASGSKLPTTPPPGLSNAIFPSNICTSPPQPSPSQGSSVLGSRYHPQQSTLLNDTRFRF